ncbi:MAG: hypothetical protein WDA09_08145, partial [Bacteriovoracaceae bacterium]
DTKMAAIEFPQIEKKVAKVVKTKPVVEKIAEQKSQPEIILEEKLINFEEPVKLSTVKIEYSLPTNLASLMPKMDFEVMVAEVEAPKEEIKEDNVSTAQASVVNVEEEPVFFEYPKAETVTVTETTKTPETTVVNETNSTENVKAFTKADYEKMADEFIAFDYSQESVEQPVVKTSTLFTNKVVPAVNVDKKEEAAPVVKKAEEKKPAQKVSMNTQSVQKETVSMSSQKRSLLPSVMSIQAKATDFIKLENIKNFEIRFQDDLNEIYEDFGAGEVQLATRVSSIMNRSMVLLKRGYAPTNTDLIIESNSKVTLPLIEEAVFNALLDKSNRTAAAGALLIEFDDDTETVLLDAEYSEEILLDGNMKQTYDEDFKYKLFIGLNAGNVYVTYKHFDGTETSKIVHIHEREVTFDANIYENIKHNKVTLYEEGLLAKELSPLIATGEQVRVFATDLVGTKLKQNTYKFNKKRSLLGDRQYLEVNHLSEPVFVGFRDNNKIVLPSEDFINFVLTKFEDRRLGNRCIIQVNIDRPVANYFVGTESAGNNLVTNSQVLDQDGKFYDTVGPKSNKIIILGENHGSPDQSQDGKVNIKIDYLDGTSRFLSSYCSPNTYLVEQL